MTGADLCERICVKQKNEGPHWAGLRRVIFVETRSYARARQRLALLFARLVLLPASTMPRAAGAVKFWWVAATECMGELEQIRPLSASAGDRERRGIALAATLS
jgi:hypothetical protein